MKKCYFKIDANGIVISTIQTNDVMGSDYIECDDVFNILGKKWNGKTFEEVPIEVVEEPETTEVTNEDLLEVLLAIGEKVGA